MKGWSERQLKKILTSHSKNWCLSNFCKDLYRFVKMFSYLPRKIQQEH